MENIKAKETECECKAPLCDFDDDLEMYCTFCHGYIELDVDE